MLLKLILSQVCMVLSLIVFILVGVELFYDSIKEVELSKEIRERKASIKQGEPEEPEDIFFFADEKRLL